MSVKPLTLRHPYQDEEARANLRTFVRLEDRASPPIFVGREKIIEKIVEDVSECRSNTDETACFTRVIHGAPGAGKTSLLSELQRLLDGGMVDGKRVDTSVVVARLSGHHLSNAEYVANTLIHAYTGDYLDVQKERATSTTLKSELAGLGGGHQRTTTERRLREQIQDSGQLWQAIKDHTSIRIEDTVFLLLIDEAQTVEGNSLNAPDGRNTTIMSLHEGSFSTLGIKFVAVFAGLSDTVPVLADRGISRIKGSLIQLGGLSSNETEDLVSSWMRHPEFGFENLFHSSDIIRVSKMIAVASEGWPRHANTYLREFGRSVLELSIRDDMKVDLNGVFERGHEDRLTYYENRLSAANLGRFRRVIRDAAKQSQDGVVELESLSSVAENEYGLSEAKYETLHEKAIHAGILEPAGRSDDESFTFPIPSLFTYMRCDGDEVEFKTKMREQMDAHAHLWTESSKGVSR